MRQLSKLRLLVCLALSVQLCFARPKRDIVAVINGNEVTCEIRRLNRGMLNVKTDSLGDISIRWEDVTRIRSEFVFEISLSDGSYHFGARTPGPSGNLLLPGEPAIPLLSIVELIPIESRVKNRFNGSVDLGYNFQKSDETSQLNVNAEIAYTTRRRNVQTQVSDTLIVREGSDTTKKTQALLLWNETLSRGSFALVLGQYSINSQLDLINRYLAGGGLGRYLIHSNRSIFAIAGGGAYSLERYAGAKRRSNAEALLNLNTQTFRLRSPKLDIIGDLKFWPNLTTRGRFRIDATAKAKIEVHKNLFVSFQLLDSYDRKNPTTSLPQNDYGLVMSIGYTFNR